MATINYTYGIVGANPECEVITNARCVAYNGTYLPALNIKDGDDLEQILLLLDNSLEAVYNLYQSGLNIRNIGAGAELYDGLLIDTQNFKTVTTHESILLGETTEELSLGVSISWLNNYVNDLGIQWGAEIRLSLINLEQRIDTLTSLGIDISALINSINSLVYNTQSLQLRLQAIKTTNTTQALDIQQDANDIFNLFGLHFTLSGNYLYLRDRNGSVLSSVDICTAVANCQAEYIFLNSGSTADVSWAPLATGSTVSYNITSTKSGVAHPWYVASKPAWVAVESGDGTSLVTFRASTNL